MDPLWFLARNHGGQGALPAAIVRNSRLGPIALEVFGAGDAWGTAVRIEGRPGTVASAIETLENGGAWSVRLEGEESELWWRRYVQRQRLTSEPGRIVLRCGYEPKQAATIVEAITATIASHDISQERWLISPGLGSAVVELGIEGDGASTLSSIQQALLSKCASVTVLCAPPDWKQAIDVWGRVPETVSVMRALKMEFDPQSVLNRGRFVDRI